MQVIYLTLAPNHLVACWLTRSKKGKFHRHHFDQSAMVDKRRPYLKLSLSKQVLVRGRVYRPLNVTNGRGTDLYKHLGNGLRESHFCKFVC